MTGLLAIVLPALLMADGEADTPRNAIPPAAFAPEPRRSAEPERIELKDAKDGTGDLVYEATGFTARVAPDGSVRFGDKRVSGLTPAPWLPMNAPMAVPSLQSTITALVQGRSPPPPPPSELDKGEPPAVTRQLIPEVSRYRPDLREGCVACTGYTDVVLPVNALGRFDVADELTRLSGQDPNREQKAVFLAATRDYRLQMAVNARAADMRRARADAPAQLQAIACDDRLTHEQRRGSLAALASEMDTSTPEGARAAESLNAFIADFDASAVDCGAAP